jgi:hypothetical protein
MYIGLKRFNELWAIDINENNIPICENYSKHRKQWREDMHIGEKEVSREHSTTKITKHRSACRHTSARGRTIDMVGAFSSTASGEK